MIEKYELGGQTAAIYSVGEGLPLIRARCRRGLARHPGEVTPHHLFFDETWITRRGNRGRMQMNPPLRADLRPDRAARSCLRNGEWITWPPTTPRTRSQRKRILDEVPVRAAAPSILTARS